MQNLFLPLGGNFPQVKPKQFLEAIDFFLLLLCLEVLRNLVILWVRSRSRAQLSLLNIGAQVTSSLGNQHHVSAEISTP